MTGSRRGFLAGAATALSGSLVGCLGVLDGKTETGSVSKTDSATADGVRTATPTDGATATGTAGSETSSTSIRDLDGTVPQYQFDAANTGAVSDVTGPTASPAATFTFGGGGVESGHSMGSPTVVDGTIYLTEGIIDENDDATSTVYALDARDGTVQWSREYSGTNVASATAVSGDVVLARISGKLVGLDRATGEQQWSFSKDLDSRIVVDDGVAYIGGVGYDSAHVYALTASDGTLRWKAPVETEVGLPMPAVVDGTVYTGSKRLVALDAETGEQRWESASTHPVSAPPTVAGDTVVFGSKSKLRAYERTDGEQRWSTEVETFGSGGPAFLSSSPAVADGTVFVVSGWGLSAYDLANGDRSYLTELGINGAPVIAGDHLYVSGVGSIACVATADGSIAWVEQTAQSSGSGGRCPAVVDGVAYFPAVKLYAVTA